MPKPVKIAYVQKSDDWNADENGGEWWSDNCQLAAENFEEMGYTVIPFTKHDLAKLPFAKDTIVKGNIRITRAVLDILGVKQPKNVDIPSELMKFAKRKVWQSTLGAVRKKGERVHIKPLLKQKDFKGHVFDPTYPCRYSYIQKLSNFPDNYKVLCSEEVEFGDELRFVVLNGTIIGKPNESWYDRVEFERLYKFVKKIIKAYVSAPPAYVVDVGFMMLKNRNFWYGPISALVEINSAWSASLDCSNMATEDVVKFLETSWNHLMQG